MSCYRDLNPGPLPYQGSALPLSYNSKKKKSGRRGSNPRPSAWKANALSTELLPQKTKDLSSLKNVGKDGFEPPKSKDSRFTVCPIWPLWYLPNLLSKNNSFSASFLEPLVGFEPTTPRLQITCSGHLSYRGLSYLTSQPFRLEWLSGCKVRYLF